MSHYRLKQSIEDAIFDWLTAILPATTILWDKQDVQAPGDSTKEAAEEPLLSLNIISGPTKVGTASQRYDSTLDTFVYQFHKSFVLSINVYTYSDHLAMISQILNGTEMPKFLSILKTADVSIWTTTGPRDLSELLNTGHRFRANVDITFAYSEETQDDPDRIETTVVTATINNREVENTIEGGS